MTIMVSLNQKNELFDPIRKKWVEKTPEEIIRQALIQKMLNELGYPLSLLAVEKELSKLPHLSLVSNLPKRRADIIVFAKNIHSEFSLFPLLMIECKATLLMPKFVQQVVGYNRVVKAPFIAVANDRQLITGSFDSEVGVYSFKKGLPSFDCLLRTCLHRPN